MLAHIYPSEGPSDEDLSVDVDAPPGGALNICWSEHFSWVRLLRSSVARRAPLSSVPVSGADDVLRDRL
jgi:hypothetical protein